MSNHTWLILTLSLPGYAHVGAGAHEGTSAPLELELQEVVSQLTWELGRELKSLQEDLISSLLSHPSSPWYCTFYSFLRQGLAMYARITLNF